MDKTIKPECLILTNPVNEIPDEGTYFQYKLPFTNSGAFGVRRLIADQFYL